MNKFNQHRIQAIKFEMTALLNLKKDLLLAGRSLEYGDDKRLENLRIALDAETLSPNLETDEKEETVDVPF